MFDLSITKLLVLGVLALVIFGPEQLPKMAQQLGRTLRELRGLADKARTELHEGLGPEFAEFDIADLNPRTFVQRHIIDELDGIGRPVPAAARRHPMDSTRRPPFDSEAT